MPRIRFEGFTWVLMPSLEDAQLRHLVCSSYCRSMHALWDQCIGAAIPRFASLSLIHI